MVGHRAEKYRKTDGYEEALVRKFETQMRSAVHIRTILNKQMDTKRTEEMDYKQTREVELAKELPSQTSFMIGRTVIPKWIGQEFNVWKKQLEKWNEIDKSLEETEYFNMIENNVWL